MEQLKKVMQQMINVSDAEFQHFTSSCHAAFFKKQTVLNRVGHIPNEIFFIEKGLIRVSITDQAGTEHTIHFALENQFIADYSCFIQKIPSFYTLSTLEDTEAVVLPRSAIEWGYEHLEEGQKMGRLVAEFYFIYQDNRIKNTYIYSPKERYDHLTEIFPNIHNRVPQHLIASYLGITSVHLSRLKKNSRK